MVKPKNNNGMSLIEILVVITIFAILGIMVTQSIVSTIGGSKKSESLIKVRENLNYSISVIERQLRNANSVDTCPNTDPTRIDYQDQYGNSSSFSCLNGYIASGSARLTNDEVSILSCSFVCTLGVDTPSTVTIDLSAKNINAITKETSIVKTTNKIQLRNY